jgi:hypothetical protein
MPTTPTDDIRVVDYVCSLAPPSNEREPLKLSAIYVPPHVRVYEGEIVKVEGYWRDETEITPQERRKADEFVQASIKQAAHQQGWDVEGGVAFKIMSDSRMQVEPDNGMVRASVRDASNNEVAHVSYTDVDESFKRVKELHRQLFGAQP